MTAFTDRQGASGFTLIELSIVLVIIGLIVGGVLVSKDLIRAAEVRATISQIEKYNTAANTFRGKYGYLPGDIKDPDASQFGFIARGGSSGQGDGNGVIEGSAASACGFCEGNGETVVFWVDLSTAHLIEGGFNTASEWAAPGTAVTGTALSLYLPAAKVGGGNYLYVWSGGPTDGWTTAEVGNNGLNYLGLSAVSQLGGYWQLYSSPGLTVAQAYAIDKKMDDGLPQSGRVVALHLNGDITAGFSPTWAGTGGATGAPYTTATSGSATTCFDNGNSAGAAQQYSLTQNSGNGVNCALSFQFQ